MTTVGERLIEGLAARFDRHQRSHLALKQGLEKLGLRLAAQEGHRLIESRKTFGKVVFEV